MKLLCSSNKKEKAATCESCHSRPRPIEDQFGPNSENRRRERKNTSPLAAHQGLQCTNCLIRSPPHSDAYTSTQRQATASRRTERYSTRTERYGKLEFISLTHQLWYIIFLSKQNSFSWLISRRTHQPNNSNVSLSPSSSSSLCAKFENLRAKKLFTSFLIYENRDFSEKHHSTVSLIGSSLFNWISKFRPSLFRISC